jgi:hypothetical protein
VAGVSICLTRSRVSTWEPNLRQYRVQYKVVMSDKLDGPEKVLSYMAAQGYVVRGLTYSAGNDADQFALLVKIGAPRRDGGDTSRTTWLVETEYEFDLESQPTLRPAKIEPFFIEEQEPIVTSVYGGAFTRSGNNWVPKGLTSPTYIDGREYPIGNSANVPVLPVPERPALRPAYRVSWLKATPINAAFYAGTWNTESFTLFTLSVTYNAPNRAAETFPLFFKTFAPATLRLAQVQQPTRTIYGREWYEVTLEFVEDDFRLYELDRGVSARAKAGDPDGRGGTYSEGDFPEGSSGQRAILDGQGQPIGEPVLLDGQGKPLRDQSDSLPAVYLRWNKGETTTFSELGIGNPN